MGIGEAKPSRAVQLSSLPATFSRIHQGVGDTQTSTCPTRLTGCILRAVADFLHEIMLHIKPVKETIQQYEHLKIQPKPCHNHIAKMATFTLMSTFVHYFLGGELISGRRSSMISGSHIVISLKCCAVCTTQISSTMINIVNHKETV